MLIKCNHSIVGTSQAHQKTDNPEIYFKERLHSFEEIQVLLHRTFAITFQQLKPFMIGNSGNYSPKTFGGHPVWKTELQQYMKCFISAEPLGKSEKDEKLTLS